ncbi:hypothetical protein [Roseibium sp. SCP14]|uniref:hypothetical protein n=1 Tax=Roseibium sp. SCP14 TaxID=3141375 RepID=UPI00333968B1
MIRLVFALMLSITAVQPVEAQATVTPKLKTALEENAAIPGQPLIYRISLLVPTWMPTPPIFPNIEVPNVMVRLPSRASGPTSETIDGETWSGVTRSYRLYPLVPGRFQIPGGTIKVVFADPETRQPIETEVAIEPFEIIGTLPVGAEDLVPFLAANKITLDRQVEGDPTTLQPGASLKVTTKATISGAPPMVLPSLANSAEYDGVSFYPNEPVIEEKEDRGLLSGTREQAFTIVAESAGKYETPAYSLSWYNLKTGEIETAQVSSIHLTVIGSADAAAPETRDLNLRSLLTTASTALIVIGILFFLVRWLGPKLAGVARQRWRTFKGSEAYAYQELKRQVRRRNLHEVYKSGNEWRTRLSKLDAALDWTDYEAALIELGKKRYRKIAPDDQASSNTGWKKLVTAIRNLRKTRLNRSRQQRQNSLPTLNPS